MSIYYIKGNLLNSSCDYICHQVNCQGVMGSGVAKQIKEKWPIVYEEYKNKFNSIIGQAYLTKPKYHPFFGEVQFINIDKETNQQIVNMFAQENYGYDGKRYTSYDAFWMCLGQIKDNIPKGETIAFPRKIGCDRGGANWNIILAMIDEVLSKDYEVYIYHLED